jgi:hypothetical protein
MIIRAKTHLLLPLLALGTTLVVAGLVHAQDRYNQPSGGVSASLHVSFGTTPHWMGISGTRVEEIRQAERPNYDMFRYGGSYYAYNNNRWYMSRRESGEFAMIDDRSVPSELSMVPREHWHNYPSGWQGRHDQGPNGTSASLQISFGTQPRWTNVRGTRVTMIRQGQRPGYDMFRYGRNYYVYNNNRWYMSHRQSGQFAVIDDRSVPTELSRVPRDQWHNYPPAWSTQSGNPRNGSNGQRR